MKSIQSKFMILLSVVFVILILANDSSSQNTRERTSNDKLKYVEMTESEKRQFVETKADEILGLFRRVKGDEITAAGVGRIKGEVDSYFRRLSLKLTQSAECKIGGNLKSVLQRGNTYAPVINSAFTEKNLPPQIGIYIAMIETEFCPCLKSPIGALGMFQFSKSNGEVHGLKTVAGADEKKPDDRCKPDLAARAASLYFNKLLDENFGRNAIGFPLAVAAYNAGEGNTKVNLRNVREDTKTEDISFWFLTDYIVKKYDKSADEKEAANDSDEEENNKIPRGVNQFLLENVKYVPKFFAAAIIGENPNTFGLEMSPLSQSRADSKQTKRVVR